MFYRQLNIFDQPAGESLAQAGIDLAVETANNEHGNWSERCWVLFWHWLNRKPRYFEFMIEDFREYLYCYDLIEKPHTDRAFGFLSRQAVKENLIEWAGNRRVRNKKAHATPASVWRKK